MGNVRVTHAAVNLFFKVPNKKIYNPQCFEEKKGLTEIYLWLL